jgi:hypothetical protein
MDDIEILVKEATPRKRGGPRVGAGRPSLVRENNKRIAEGLPPIPKNTKLNKRVQKSKAILPENKKARAQEVLAEMLGRKGKYVVQKVLDKALTDGDPDQMACLKLVMDRVLPADYLSKIKSKSNQIQINISGVGQDVEVIGEEVDGEIIEEDDE